MILENRETPRLLLRTSHPDLAEAVSEYYIRNRDFLREFEPIREECFFSQAEQARTLLSDLSDENRCRFWIAEKTAPTKIIGMTGLNGIVRGAFQSCYLSYKLDERKQGRGFATEAVNSCVRLGFEALGLHRVEANIMPRNRRSLRVVEKLGFVNEGISRQYLYINGFWEDHVHMVLLNENWKP